MKPINKSRMEQKYLKNGEVVYAVGEKDNKILVRKSYKIFYEDSVEEVIGEELYLVDKVYDLPPTAIIEESIQKLLKTKSLYQKELIDIQNEISKAKKELTEVKNSLTDISKKSFVINKNELLEAKSIHFFSKREIKPIKVEEEEITRLQIITYIGKNREDLKYAVKDSTISEYQRSNDMDLNYGLLINKSEEELIELCLERQNIKNDFTKWVFEKTEDKWLTEANKKLRQEILKESREIDKKNYLNSIQYYQKKLDELNNETK